MLHPTKARDRHVTCTPISEDVFEPILNCVKETLNIAPHIIGDCGDVVYSVLNIV